MTRVKLRGLFAAEDDRAPYGWVEIQRDDTPEPGDSRYASDDDAALAVARAAQCVGSAMCYSPGLKVLLPLVATEAGADVDVTHGVFARLDALAEADGACPRWIAIVPVAVAVRAGLYTKKRSTR